ncbi:hypothetical protein ACWGI8_41685, partial [Streptomyces sp. NPDC054841]
MRRWSTLHKWAKTYSECLREPLRLIGEGWQAEVNNIGELIAVPIPGMTRSAKPWVSVSAVHASSALKNGTDGRLWNPTRELLFSLPGLVASTRSPQNADQLMRAANGVRGLLNILHLQSSVVGDLAVQSLQNDSVDGAGLQRVTISRVTSQLATAGVRQRSLIMYTGSMGGDRTERSRILGQLGELVRDARLLIYVPVAGSAAALLEHPIRGTVVSSQTPDGRPSDWELMSMRPTLSMLVAAPDGSLIDRGSPMGQFWYAFIEPEEERPSAGLVVSLSAGHPLHDPERFPQSAQILRGRTSADDFGAYAVLPQRNGRVGLSVDFGLDIAPDLPDMVWDASPKEIAAWLREQFRDPFPQEFHILTDPVSTRDFPQFAATIAAVAVELRSRGRISPPNTYWGIDPEQLKPTLVDS